MGGATTSPRRHPTASSGASIGSDWRTAMTASEPDAEAWRRLFASLTGESAVDAAMVRAFCDTYRVTPAQVMS